MAELIEVKLRDGARVRAQVAGNGPPLVLYANMVSWEFWEQQIPALAQRYRVIAPEYRSDPIPGVGALDTLAADVPDLVRALGYERALLMGHSIGSMVLARLLDTDVSCAAAVVLANGFWRMRVLPPMLHRLQPPLGRLLWAIYPRLPWTVRQIGSYALLWGDQHIFLRREPDAPKRRMFYAYTFTPDPSMVLRLRAALDYHQPPDLRRAHVPALLVSSSEDRWVPLGDARALAERLPCGEHVIVPGVGHMLPMIAPDVFNRVVLEFLGRVQGRVL